MSFGMIPLDPDQKPDGFVLLSMYENLEAENAKLRELVEDMLDCIDIQIAFERVPARWMQDEFAGRARELGVEVEE